MHLVLRLPTWDGVPLEAQVKTIVRHLMALLLALAFHLIFAHLPVA